MSQSEFYTIFCIIEGEDSAFSVKIASHEPVDVLKKAIKIEKFKTLADIEADTLKLYHVSILMHDPQDMDMDIDYAAKAQEEMSRRQPPLELRNPAKSLTRVFKDAPPKDTLHIIVRRPSGGLLI
jgi:hypothetical protein